VSTSTPQSNLTILRGGADPVELARLEDKAEEAMRAYLDALPPSDECYVAIQSVAEILKLRRSRREFHAARVARRRELEATLAAFRRGENERGDA